MASLHEFLDVLVADPNKLARFNTSPQDAKTVMTQEGVSPADQTLLTDGTDAQIRGKLKKELTDKANAYVIRMSPQP